MLKTHPAAFFSGLRQGQRYLSLALSAFVAG
jgi:hypothetical protein